MSHNLPSQGSEDASRLLVRPRVEEQRPISPRGATDALVEILLAAAPTGARFDGTQIWDVMLSLGLEHSDLGGFQWKQDGEAHFTVFPATPPGYFLPMLVADGLWEPRILIFEFAVGRSVAPEAALEGVLAAATYAQRRLGGFLYDSKGQPLDPQLLRRALRLFTRGMLPITSPAPSV